MKLKNTIQIIGPCKKRYIQAQCHLHYHFVFFRTFSFSIISLIITPGIVLAEIRNDQGFCYIADISVISDFYKMAF